MSGPFDMGMGRNGPGALLGQGRGPKPAQPYRPDVSDVDFVAVGDVIVCVIAAPRKEVDRGDVKLELAETESPFHIVISVGEKVPDKLGVELDPGDTVFLSGAHRVDTVAGSVFFARAEHVLSVIQKKRNEPVIPQGAA